MILYLKAVDSTVYLISLGIQLQITICCAINAAGNTLDD